MKRIGRRGVAGLLLSALLLVVLSVLTAKRICEVVSYGRETVLFERYRSLPPLDLRAGLSNTQKSLPRVREPWFSFSYTGKTPKVNRQRYRLNIEFDDAKYSFSKWGVHNEVMPFTALPTRPGGDDAGWTRLPAYVMRLSYDEQQEALKAMLTYQPIGLMGFALLDEEDRLMHLRTIRGRNIIGGPNLAAAQYWETEDHFGVMWFQPGASRRALVQLYPVKCGEGLTFDAAWAVREQPLPESLELLLKTLELTP